MVQNLAFSRSNGDVRSKAGANRKNIRSWFADFAFTAMRCAEFVNIEELSWIPLSETFFQLQLGR